MPSPVAEARGRAEVRRIRYLLPLILLLLALALALKAWQEHLDTSRAGLDRLQGDANTLAERIEARIQLAHAAIAISEEAGVARTRTAGLMPGVEAILSLSDAARSPEGSRLNAASGTASEFLRHGHGAGLSARGDLIILSAPDPRNPVLAVASAESLFRDIDPRARVSIHDRGHSAGFGNPDLATSASRTVPAGRPAASGPASSRTATACAAVSSSALLVCTTRALPFLGHRDLLNITVFGLLLLAFGLALSGLVRRLSRKETELLVHETRTREADRILGMVMKGARAGYWEWSRNSDSVFLSEGAAALFAMETSQTLSLQGLLERLPSESRRVVTDGFLRAAEIGWLQLTFVSELNPLRWIEMRGSLSADPVTGASVFGGIMLDATDRKQAEDRVRAAERRLRSAIEGFTGPFALWDARRRLLYWNRAFAMDFGLQDTLRAGMSHDTVEIARAGSVLTERAVSEDGLSRTVQLRNGRWLRLVERQTPDGGLISVGIDVTGDVRNEDDLRKLKEKASRLVVELERSEDRQNELSRKFGEEKEKAERAAHSKSVFLANMSHELRTPLNAIIGFSEIMNAELAGPLGDPSYKEYTRDILTSGQHLLDIINDLLDMARFESGQMTISPKAIDPVDPVDAAIRMIRRKAEDKEISLVLEAQQNLPEIDADHRAIRQMMLNLLSNAVRFTQRGGVITVNVEQRGTDIYFAVTDTGIGIPADQLPRLGQPFEQVTRAPDQSNEGMGLGLALTRSFAEMHGGRMLLTSIYGEGTTAAFVLPVGGPSSVRDDLSRYVA